MRAASSPASICASTAAWRCSDFPDLRFEQKDRKMNIPPTDPAIETLIHDVVQDGSAYDIESMETHYAADQSFLLLGSDGHVTRVARDSSIPAFRARREPGAPPLSPDHPPLHHHHTSP